MVLPKTEYPRTRGFIACAETFDNDINPPKMPLVRFYSTIHISVLQSKKTEQKEENGEQVDRGRPYFHAAPVVRSGSCVRGAHLKSDVAFRAS